MEKIWVLAGDTSCARVFATDRRNGDLEEQFDLVNPEARLHERELTSDLPGRTANSATRTRHGYGGEDTKKHHATTRFAREISERLEKARIQGKWEKLYIVADPSFLGELRKCLDPDTAQRVTGEVDKNLARGTAADVRRVLPDFL